MTHEHSWETLPDGSQICFECDARVAGQKQTKPGGDSQRDMKTKTDLNGVTERVFPRFWTTNGGRRSGWFIMRESEMSVSGNPILSVKTSEEAVEICDRHNKQLKGNQL